MLQLPFHVCFYTHAHTQTHTLLFPIHVLCIHACIHTDRDAPTSFYVYMYTRRHADMQSHADTRRHTYVCIHINTQTHTCASPPFMYVYTQTHRHTSSCVPYMYVYSHTHTDTQALAFLTCMYTHTHTQTHTLPFPSHVCVYAHRHTATHALASRSCKYIYPHGSIGKTLADKLVPMKKMDWRLKGWLKINVMLPLYYSYQRISGWKKNYNEYCWQERFKGPIRDFGKGGRG